MSQGFHRPSSVRQALELKASLGPEAVFLAGGSEINQKHHPVQPSQLISLAGLELDGVAPDEWGLVIGATTTFQQLLEAPEIPAILREAASRLVNRNVRNVATVGGQIATGKSCADLLPTLTVLGARVMVATLEGSGAWSVLDYLQAKPAGLIVAVELPSPAPGLGCAMGNFTRTANDLSVLTCAVSLARDGDAIVGPVLAMGGVAATTIRLTAVEAALAGQPLAPRDQLEALIARAVTPIDDLRGSAAFKRALAGSLGADALIAAFNAAEAR